MSAQDEILYLTVEKIMELHDIAIESHGGSAGVLNEGHIESAVGRLQNSYYDDVVEMAGALMESLLMNHCFVDGNKRVAFLATHLFLLKNGHDMSPGTDSKTIEIGILGLFDRGEVNHDNLVKLLRDNIKKI